MSRTSYASALLASLVLVLLSANAVFAQSNDRHTTGTSRALYMKSAYAHGYMHGYEEGFHNGDLDIHMGRGERPLNQVKSFRDCAGYRPQFGDKKYFRQGYQQGFREGYTDAVSNRSFRAYDATRRISESMPEKTDISERDFDNAFARGYEVGLDVGTKAPSDRIDEEHTNRICESKLANSSTTPTAVCDAFSRGFQLGFSDGFVGRAQARTETARNTTSTGKR